MRVVRSVELVFDCHEVSRAAVPGEDVQPELPNGALGLDEFKIQTQDASELVEILCEPRGKIVGFVGPHFGWVHRAHSPEGHADWHILAYHHETDKVLLGWRPAMRG